MATVVPCRPGTYTITQPFGYTGLVSNGPFVYEGRYYPTGFHNGVDMAGPLGTPVYATQHGTVFVAAWNGEDPRPDVGGWAIGGGNTIIIEHRDGRFFSCYSHLDRMLVKVGQDVFAGQLIGYMGSTGYSSGPHLHHSLWFDTDGNPATTPLWYTNGGRGENPAAYWPGGPRANYIEAQPDRMKITGSLVNARSSATTEPGDANIRRAYGRGAVLPFFRYIKGQKLTLAGVTSDQWAKSYDRGWIYIWSGLMKRI